MAEKTTTAAKYAVALFDVHKKDIDSFLESLAMVKDALADPSLSRAFLSVRMGVRQKKEWILKSLGRIQNLHAGMIPFLQLLIDKRRENELAEIENELRRLVYEERGVVRVEAAFAVDMKNEQDGIYAILDEKIKAEKASFGLTKPISELQMKSRVDTSIVAGFVIRIGDYVWDASAKKYLSDWKKRVLSSKKYGNNVWE